MAKMPELAGKDDETVFTTAWCAFEKLKGTWRTSDRQEICKKNQTKRPDRRARPGQEGILGVLDVFTSLPGAVLSRGVHASKLNCTRELCAVDYRSVIPK